MSHQRVVYCPAARRARPRRFDILCQFAHGFLRDGAPFTTSKASFRFINGSKDFHAVAFPLLPQGKSSLHRVFLAPKPPAIDGLADKRLLVGTELYFHTFKVRIAKPAVKRGFNRQNPRIL